MIHADSSFAIDLLREQRRGQQGPASRWMDAHADEAFAVSVFVWCELESGAAGAAQPASERIRIRDYLQTVAIVFPDQRFAPKYATLLHSLQARGRVIGEMDLLIATTALIDDVSIVTANGKHFEGVPDLRVLTYR